MDYIIADGIQVLVPPDAGLRKDTRLGWNGGQRVRHYRIEARAAGRTH